MAKASSANHFLVFLVTFLFVLAAFSGSTVGWFWLPPFDNPDGCQDVYNNFNSCENFVDGASQFVSPECCSGLVYLDGIAKNNANEAGRICQCIENSAAVGNKRYSETRIENLYYNCNIHLSFPISEHMDCSRVN